MNRLLALLAFIATMAISIVLSGVASIYVFAFWDPVFWDRRDNVIVLTGATPFLVTLSSVSFFIGLLVSQTFTQADRRGAIKVGVLGAILVVLSVSLVIAVNVNVELAFDTLELMTLTFAPSVAAVVAALIVERRSRQ